MLEPPKSCCEGTNHRSRHILASLSGNYANVLLVKKKGGDEYFAMKILSKDSLIARDEVEHTRTGLSCE